MGPEGTFWLFTCPRGSLRAPAALLWKHRRGQGSLHTKGSGGGSATSVPTHAESASRRPTDPDRKGTAEGADHDRGNSMC